MNAIKFLRRIPYLFSSALLGTIASYVLYINISKRLGFDDFSTVSYWMNLGAIFTVLFDLGINQYLQVNYQQNIRVLAASLLGLKLVLGLAVSCALLLFVRDFSLYLFLVSFLFVSFQAFFSYYLRLQQRFRLDIVFNLVYYGLFLFVFLYFLHQQQAKPTILYAWVHFVMRLLLMAIIAAMLVWQFKQRVIIRTLFKDKEQLRKIIGFSFLSLLFVGVQNIDAIILFRRISDAALFSKLSMVIKIGLLNYAFFDAFITLVSASFKNEEKQDSLFGLPFKLCLAFAFCIAISLHVMVVLLPHVVGDKWAGISAMSVWAVGNNLALYLMLYFQFRLMASGKIRLVAAGLICFMVCSALISNFFVSYQSFFVLSALLKLTLAAAYVQACRKAVFATASKQQFEPVLQTHVKQAENSPTLLM